MQRLERIKYLLVNSTNGLKTYLYMEQFGTLKEADLRDYWKNEATDFTLKEPAEPKQPSI